MLDKLRRTLATLAGTVAHATALGYGGAAFVSHLPQRAPGHIARHRHTRRPQSRSRAVAQSRSRAVAQSRSRAVAQSRSRAETLSIDRTTRQAGG